MNYDDRLGLVKAYLPGMVAEMVKDSYLKFEDRKGFFMCWLQMEATFEIPDMYAGEFKKRFGNYITLKVENDIRLVAGMTRNFLKAYVDIQEDELKPGRMCHLVKAFVEEQIADFGNWCGEVCIGMPDEDEKE
jgi:hypothetical protein